MKKDLEVRAIELQDGRKRVEVGGLSVTFPDYDGLPDDPLWLGYSTFVHKNGEYVMHISTDSHVHFGNLFVWRPDPTQHRDYFISKLLEAESEISAQCSAEGFKQTYRTIAVYDEFNEAEKTPMDKLTKEQNKQIREDHERRQEIPILPYETVKRRLESLSFFQRFIKLIACNDHVTLGLGNLDGIWAPEGRHSEVFAVMENTSQHSNYVDFYPVLRNLFFQTSQYNAPDFLPFKSVKELEFFS